MCKYGISQDSSCGLCQMGVETIDHLLFECPFSYRVWKSIRNKCCVNWADRTWDEWVELCAKELRGKKLGTYVKKLAFSASVYSIWRERNNRVFRKESKPEEVIVHEIVNLVRCRLMSMKRIKTNNDDGWFLKEWNLPGSILRQI